MQQFNWNNINNLILIIPVGSNKNFLILKLQCKIYRTFQFNKTITHLIYSARKFIFWKFNHHYVKRNENVSGDFYQIYEHKSNIEKESSCSSHNEDLQLGMNAQERYISSFLIFHESVYEVAFIKILAQWNQYR